MGSTSIPIPCLTPVLAGLFRAKAGQICLALTDLTGNTDFDTSNCAVQDISTNPSVPVPNDSLTAKKWCFTLGASKSYSVQLVVAQNPGIGSRSNLTACGVSVMGLDDTNQIQTWKVQS
jgi:hypothetical protein